MNNDIKAGDLVMIVNPKECCGHNDRIGHVFTVLPKQNDNGFRCQICGKYLGKKDYYFNSPHQGVHKSRLIKIDPPALQDETEKELELAL